MTAPIADPSWSLKIERVRRKIRALESGKSMLGADPAEILAAIAVFEAEINVLRMAYAREMVGDLDEMREAAKGSIYARRLGAD
ncbi:hypothetical protein PQQ53_21355 [Paraburkholderia strydomiana]|uniref:hypothetical protein n=1 Tax=Paraburkholderia strydomiana TaxID=1245417 RepID=UPI0038B8FE2A